YDADNRRADARAGGHVARNPLPRPVRPGTYRQAREFRPLVEAVAARRGLALAEMLAPGRPLELVEARQEAMWGVRHAGAVPTDWSVVAAAVGRSHRTTAFVGVRRFEA